jgi:integrase
VRGYLRERDRRKVKNRKGTSKTWQLVVDDGVEIVEGVKRRRQVVRSFFGTRREAEDELRDFIQSIQNGTHVRDRKQTVAQYLDLWLGHKRATVAFKTYLAYELHVRTYLKPALGSLRIANLRKEHVRKALADWSQRTAYPGKKSKTPVQKISPRTVHHVFSTLRTAMHDALDDGAISVLPFAKRMSPKKGRAEISALDETQIVALLSYLDGTLLGPVTRLAIYTGMRRGELLGLTWDAIDLDNRVLHVRQSLEVIGAGKDRAVRFKAPKTEKSRRDVALTSGAIEVLRSQHAQQSKLRLHISGPFGDERLVFPDPRTGEPWKPDTFSNEFLRAVKASGLPKVSFHGLRHSYASISLRAGTPLKVVSEMLGHTTTAITADLYTHVLGDLKAQAADRLDKIFESAEKRRVVGAEEGAWAKCGPITRAPSKKLSKIRPFLVAPTGIEPLLCGPGRSRALTKTLILSGFRRFAVPTDSDQYRGDLAGP